MMPILGNNIQLEYSWYKTEKKGNNHAFQKVIAAMLRHYT